MQVRGAIITEGGQLARDYRGASWVWVAGTDILKVQDLVSCGFLSPIHPLIQLVMRFTWRFLAHPGQAISSSCEVSEKERRGESSHPPDTPLWSQACDFIPYIHHGFCGVFTVV